MTQADGEPTWVAADWGTSHLRLWLVDGAGRVQRRIDSDSGMGTLARDGYEPVLLDLLGSVLPVRGALDVVCCGMAGSRQGWAEAPYATIPCPPSVIDNAAIVPVAETRLRVRILPGLRQLAPADVMRGEETQIAGVLAAQPGYDGVICLPGTHSKWARIGDGAVQGFGTFMTGEIFALLSRQSVLRHFLSADGWDDDAFLEAARHTIADPAAMVGALFGLRAEALVSGPAPASARARLSGLLIGAELAAARHHWQDRAVTIVGEGGLANLYARLLADQGREARIADAEQMTLGGLRDARARLEEALP